MKPGYKPLCVLMLSLNMALAALPLHAGPLAEALEQAWARHPQASALAARVDEARARADLAAGLTPGPAAVSLGHLSDNFGSGRGKQEWEVELATPLWLPGQKAAHADEAASVRNEVDARRAALRLELAGELRSAWWALAAARQAGDLAQRRLGQARTLENDVLRRYRAGDLARVDANQARGETLAAQAESRQAETAIRQAELSWRSLTGMAAPNLLEREALSSKLSPVTEHPRLAALATTARVANMRLKVAQTNRRAAPELALRVLRERGDAGTPYDNAVGIKLTIPFSSGPRLASDQAAARAEASQAEAEQQLIGQRLALDLAQARFDLDSAQQQTAWAQTRRELTADTLALAEKSFALGESDLTALLRARAAAFEAEALHNRALTAHGQALSQLKQALGEMP